MLNNYLDFLKTLRSQREMEPANITMDMLEQAIECARLGASAVNMQRVRYVLVTDKETLNTIFHATNLPTGHDVLESQAPSAYIILGTENDGPMDVNLSLDMGMQIQIIREALHYQGLASVDIMSINKKVLREVIGLENFYPQNLITVGKSNQVIKVEDSSDNTKNYTDDNGQYTVRKLTKDTLIVKKI